MSKGGRATAARPRAGGGSAPRCDAPQVQRASSLQLSLRAAMVASTCAQQKLAPARRSRARAYAAAARSRAATAVLRTAPAAPIVLSVMPRPRKHHVPHALLGLIAEGRAPGDSRPSRCGARVPARDEAAELRARAGDRVARRHRAAQQQLAPARQEERAVIELDPQHVGRRGGSRAAPPGRRGSGARARRGRIRRRGRHIAAEQLLLCASSVTRALAVQSRPSGGSTMRGCSAALVHGRPAVRRSRAGVSRHAPEDASRQCGPRRRPTTKFWCGMPMLARSASASSTVAACSSASS